MGLPEKEYFTLEELAKCWETDLSHVHYYAEHGLLDIQTWLSDAILTVYTCTTPRDEDRALVEKGLKSLTGYVIVPPKEIRAILRRGSSFVSRFTDLGRNHLYAIPYELCAHEKYTIYSEDLVISLVEKERFEKAHHLKGDQSSFPTTEPAYKSSAASRGRPSVMSKIIAQFQHRCKHKIILASLAKEASWLHAWAKETLKEKSIPKPQSIKNAIRIDYRRISKKP